MDIRTYEQMNIQVEEHKECIAELQYQIKELTVSMKTFEHVFTEMIKVLRDVDVKLKEQDLKILRQNTTIDMLVQHINVLVKIVEGM